jgi:tetratricopeptide (TPR) repeat protein
MNQRVVLSFSTLLILGAVAAYFAGPHLVSLQPGKVDTTPAESLSVASVSTPGRARACASPGGVGHDQGRALQAPDRPTVGPAVSSYLDLGGLLAEFENFLADSSPFARPITTAIQAVRVRPRSSDGWVRLGDALTAQSRATLDHSLYRKIRAIYFQAHQLDETNASALAGLAWASGACHHFEESIIWARLALKADPEMPAAYGILGDAAVELERYEEAAVHYQKMLDLRPDLGAYARAAHLLYLEGNVTRAMILMRKAIDAGAGDPEQAAWVVAELGMMQAREGASTAAVRLIDAWLEKLPENPTLLAASGHAHMTANEDAAAIAALQRAAAITPQHATLAALHDLYLAAGRNDDADRVTGQIEQLHRQLEQDHIHGSEGELARFYADRGVKLDEAVRLAQKEYSDHPGTRAADTLAWAYFRAGRATEAQKLLPEILNRSVADPAMLYHVALIEEASGKVTDARRHLHAALSRDPRFNPVHAPLAREALRRLSSRAAVAGRAQKPDVVK